MAEFDGSLPRDMAERKIRKVKRRLSLFMLSAFVIGLASQALPSALNGQTESDGIRRPSTASAASSRLDTRLAEAELGKQLFLTAQIPRSVVRTEGLSRRACDHDYAQDENVYLFYRRGDGYDGASPRV
jgi:hypothetical protein